MQVAVLLDHQRIDFQQSQVVVDEQLGQADEDVHELLDLVTLEPQLESQLAALERLRADQRVDGGLEDLLRCVVGDFLDIHATFGGGHEHDTTRGAIDHCAQVKLLGNISAGFDQNLADRLAIGIGLVGHQSLAEPLLCERSGLVLAAHQLDAAGLAATAGMHLSLDHPFGAANLVASLGGFSWIVYRVACRNRQSVLGK